MSILEMKVDAIARALLAEDSAELRKAKEDIRRLLGFDQGGAGSSARGCGR